MEVADVSSCTVHHRRQRPDFRHQEGQQRGISQQPGAQRLQSFTYSWRHGPDGEESGTQLV